MSVGIPQTIFGIVSAVGLVMNALTHSKLSVGHYNSLTTVITACVVLFIYYAGRFFLVRS